MIVIKIIALIIAAILVVAWCYYRIRLVQARKEGRSLKERLKQKETKNAENYD
ncbi:hypothetical protein [Lactobacillus sp.]|uniref:hypothetical protein n=1 Tax=Lactobacillus sp. TaxID=1591 RepID=UPI0019A65066|nr:hypothetical protein [Lactobacillus sp.]MBD5429279.1 hypothetical protein [Lactobacillus sp.]